MLYAYSIRALYGSINAESRHRAGLAWCRSRTHSHTESRPSIRYSRMAISR
jgi:hypothetical protein